MFGFSRQRKNLTGLSALIALSMVMPVGQPMPSRPAASTIQSGADASQRVAVNNRFWLLTEDDLEHHDFIVIQQLIGQGPRGTRLLISFLWTERLYRPPIT